MTIVHIGLGKTATTTLQKHVFPELARLGGYRFNDPHLVALLIKGNALKLSTEEKDDIARKLKAERHFISLEGLVNWNPAFWQWAADRNLELFGPATSILISVREPIEWMTSVYQQVIHEGNVVQPHEFFVDRDELATLAPLASPTRLDYFCSDLLDYAELDRLYSDRFDQVVIVDVSQIARMDFVDELFDLDTAIVDGLRSRFDNATSENRSYSLRAMKLTFARERLLRRFGLKTFGSADRRYHDYLALARAWARTPSMTEHRDARRSLLRRLATGRLPTWRGLMQAGLDRILPYEKFHLPKDVKINLDLVEKNRRFIAERVLPNYPPLRPRLDKPQTDLDTSR
ncbi:hypothetical protein BMG00_13110 [Thioclava marina]|uniref:Sulfotransferase family protein n=1 Tax=Thioclava marina TaxID=1915077 RepID=A0ABX3MKP2_9RHOB|nr:hypothetical protein [Thioclava marina]OOY12005.1 hypothetical protein BMG00_13110 [Thioclava marina]